MARGLQIKTGVKMKKHTSIERRRTQRFDLALAAHFRLSLKGTKSRWGTGTIHDISSSGLCLRTRRPLPVGSHLELLIDWPASHDGQHPMSLHTTCFVVRSSGTKTAMRIASHRFRIDSEEASPLSAIA
jgi:hypothetical protein